MNGERFILLIVSICLILLTAGILGEVCFQKGRAAGRTDQIIGWKIDDTDTGFVFSPIIGNDAKR